MAQFQVEFTKGERKNIPLVVAVEGPSSSGKTKSGLEICAGMCEAIEQLEGRKAKMLVCDTENRRALHYADQYDFVHYDMHPPFSPEHFGAVLDKIEAEGIDVAFFDTFSHVWSGEGGVKEWADRLEAGVPKPNLGRPPRTPRDSWDWWKDWEVRPVTSPGNWSDPKSTLKPGYRWLINRMLRSPAHIVLSLRSDEKLRIENVPVMENDGQGGERPKMKSGRPVTKTVVTAPVDMPILERFVPECEKRLPYEISTSLLFVPPGIGTPGVPIHRKVQDQHKPFIPEDRVVTREVGRILAGWSKGQKIEATGEAFDREGALATMRAAARQGTASLERAWTDAGPNVRRALQAELTGLKSTAADVDQARADQNQQGGPTDGRQEDGRNDGALSGDGPADERPREPAPDNAGGWPERGTDPDTRGDDDYSGI